MVDGVQGGVNKKNGHYARYFYFLCTVAIY